MLMGWIYFSILSASVICAIVTHHGAALSAAVAAGAQAGIQLAISLAGSVCLWSGVGKLMEVIGLTAMLSKLFQPLLRHIFPSTRNDPALAGDLSANICANLLGLGNAATPMGIQSVRAMVDPRNPHTASDQMCRLVVLNTASIQLIPATVAAVRGSLGCETPFDILPAVWLSSICSAGLGLAVAVVTGKLWPHD